LINEPGAQVEQVFASVQAVQLPEQFKHFPWFKYYPETHPGAQVVPLRRYPPLQFTHCEIYPPLQLEQAGLHAKQALDLTSP